MQIAPVLGAGLPVLAEQFDGRDIFRNIASIQADAEDFLGGFFQLVSFIHDDQARKKNAVFVPVVSFHLL